jgi:hypothetical protein
VASADHAAERGGRTPRGGRGQGCSEPGRGDGRARRAPPTSPAVQPRARHPVRPQWGLLSRPSRSARASAQCRCAPVRRPPQRVPTPPPPAWPLPRGCRHRLPQRGRPRGPLRQPPPPAPVRATAGCAHNERARRGQAAAVPRQVRAPPRQRTPHPANDPGLPLAPVSTPRFPGLPGPRPAARRLECCCATAPPATAPHPRLHPPLTSPIRQSVIHRPRQGAPRATVGP